MVHLHIHSMYSLRDSIIKPEEIVERLKQINQNSIAITDHGTSLGGVSIYKLFKENDIKYIHGCEFYTCDNVGIKDKDNKYYHLIVLCKNEIARQNMNKLISLSGKPENKYVKPRIDFDMLSENGEGFIILSACLAGEVSKYIIEGDVSKAEDVAQKYKDRFGSDYYLEIQARNDSTQIQINKQIKKIAKKLDIQCVVTTDAHYTYKEDKKYQSKYAFNGSYKEEGETYTGCYIQSENEIRENLDYFDDSFIDKVIANTDLISNMCNVEIPISAPIMPKVDTPKEYKTNKDWLIELCNDGFKEKLNINLFNHSLCDETRMLKRDVYDDEGNFLEIVEFQLTQEEVETYIERYEYELNSLDRMGFLDYILLVYSYANIVERRGIARGSGGGSLINYLTNICDIDPIEHALYFERFIDVGALDLLESGEITAKELKIPDIDLDFNGEGCDTVLKYLYDKYGQDKVASIGKFGTNQTKGSIRDMCKVLDIDLHTADEISKSFENYSIEDIDDMISEKIKVGDGAKTAINYVNEYPELFEYVRKLNGLPKSFGLHACFVQNTLVMTSKGYKTIKEVRVGDRVLTHNNNFKLVVNTSESETDYITTINASGVFPIECTPNHLFYIRHRTSIDPKVYGNPEWIMAKDIIKTDMLCSPINTKNTIPKYNNIDFSNGDIWWIIGRYIGDGWTEYVESRKEKRLIICCNKCNNTELLDIIGKLEGNFEYRYEETRTTYKIFIKNNDLYEYIQRFGKYAHKKHLTQDIFDLPTNLLNDFICGYSSADGHVDKHGYDIIKTVSYELANGIVQCISKCYKKCCSVHVIKKHEDIIEGRKVNAKEKYIVSFNKKETKMHRSFYDNESIWLYVNKITTEKKNDIVYDLSVLDDNTYTANNIAVHNCGKVVSTKDLDYFLPSCYDKGGIRYLQGDMHDVEDVGLVKVDILGLRTLDQEYDTLEMSGQTKEFINPKQSFTDKKVLDVFRNGDTVGIFQFASNGMRQTLKKMNVQCLKDVSIANAIFRPGSMQYIDNFCKRRAGTETFEYLHQDLKPILESTYGIIVFQEQIIEIGRMAKLHNPDLLRQATAKKKPKLMDKVKPELEEKLLQRGWEQEQFDKLWDDMLQFAKYSFNLSHAEAYAILAYMTAKQKAYYPAEFYAGLCNSYIGQSSFVKDDAQEIISDVERHNIPIKRFDFRQDHRRCSVENGYIIYGIPLIKDCNIHVGNMLYLIKDENFTSFYKLIKKLLELQVAKSQINILIKLDFFSEFGNSNELSIIMDIFEFLKFGEAKRISKVKAATSNIEDIILKHSTYKNKDGSESSSYTITDIDLLINDCEIKIKSQNIVDISYRKKALEQLISLGFTNLTTNKNDDLRKLMILDVFPLVGKFDDKPWCYRVTTKSVGSGKTCCLSIGSKVYNMFPVVKNDIIYADCVEKNKKGYWYIYDYTKIE